MSKPSPQTVASLGEFGLIARIAKLVPGANERLVLGIGDDCAAFRQDAEKLLLVTCDIQLEGRHFV
jgi:thiamine-monophosphate kinase